MYTSEYPDYPDLTTDEARSELASVWISSDSSHPLWHAAILNEFQRATAAREPVNPWILGFLHTQFHWVLSGSAWDDAFRLPDRAVPPEWNALSPTQQRNADLFVDVARAVEDGRKTTEAIASVAQEHNTSFETVRAAFYDWGKKVDWRGNRSKKSDTKLED
jgi:hypothetical protein